MPLIFINNITKEDAEDNPEVIFIYPDNEDRKGGNALAKELRGEDNAIGIRVKRNQYNYKTSYYDDEELAEAENNIDEDFEEIESLLRQDGVVVIKSGDFADNGVREHSPEFHNYLTDKLSELGKL